MELSAALTTHIRVLAHRVEVDHDQTVDAVDALTFDLTHAVASYRGLQLVLHEQGHPVTLTLLDPTVQPHQIAASLRLRLPAIGVPGADPLSTISFYASAPGAFVDLAADLSYALEPHDPVARHTQAASAASHRAISVDDPLLPTTMESGLVGARDLSTINRAIGMLIGEGLDPDDAREELARRAAAGHSTILACATQLVRTFRV